jgi:pSer/pThr/pTyr-binding forkhead associated (FHA) protein
MKLVFPNGEHEQHELKPGLTTIGSDSSCNVVLTQEGIAAHHAQIEIDGSGARIGVSDATNITRVNGHLVAAKTRFAGGDALLFAAVQCQVTGGGGAATAPSSQASGDEEPEASRTVVRMAVPKFILRGVSGSTFGKNFPLHGSTVIGRHSECDICLPADEVSRKHARLTIETDGLYVEDMGSANGTFINGKRVKRAKLEAGDELKLDTVRFLVQAPGMEIPSKATDEAKTVQSAATEEPEEKSSGGMKWVIILVVILGAAAAGLKFGGFI